MSMRRIFIPLLVLVVMAPAMARGQFGIYRGPSYSYIDTHLFGYLLPAAICADEEVLAWDTLTTRWECVSNAAAETDPLSLHTSGGTLTGTLRLDTGIDTPADVTERHWTIADALDTYYDFRNTGAGAMHLQVDGADVLTAESQSLSAVCAFGCATTASITAGGMTSTTGITLGDYALFHIGYVQMLAYNSGAGQRWLATLYPSVAQTSDAAFYLPPDEPAATYLLNMSSSGAIGFDTNAYLTAEADTLASVTARGATTTTGIGAKAGTAGAPSFYGTGDTNTGMWYPAADQVGIQNDGVPTWTLTANTIIAEGTGADNDFETTISITNPTADRTITIPDASGTIATLENAQTFTAAQGNSAAGDISTSAMMLTGAPSTAGTTTTDFPLLLLQPSAATPSSTWNTNGTFIGVNADLAQGMLMDLKVDGITKYLVDYTGAIEAYGGFYTSGTMIAAGYLQGGDNYNYAAHPSGGRPFCLSSAVQLAWNSGQTNARDTASSNNPDAGVAVEAAGVVKITDGSSGLGQIHATIPNGAHPAATCTVGEIFIDTDQSDDTNCTTTADNSLCLCTAADTWTALENN
jgi:hypothetical protein